MLITSYIFTKQSEIRKQCANCQENSVKGGSSEYSESMVYIQNVRTQIKDY